MEEQNRRITIMPNDPIAFYSLQTVNFTNTVSGHILSSDLNQHLKKDCVLSQDPSLQAISNSVNVVSLPLS